MREKDNWPYIKNISSAPTIVVQVVFTKNKTWIEVLILNISLQHLFPGKLKWGTGMNSFVKEEPTRKIFIGVFILNSRGLIANAYWDNLWSSNGVFFYELVGIMFCQSSGVYRKK